MINLSKQLFWDVKFNKLKYKTNINFIIQRVLSFGDLKDYQEIKKQYGLEKIKQIAPKVNYANKKSLYFWSLIFNIPLNFFKCVKKLLTKKPSAFYQHKLLFPLISWQGIQLADYQDIACMKLDAISSCGSKKDFIDLYFIMQNLPFPQLLKLFNKKYLKI